MTTKKIIREPGTGKTKELMQMCANEGATLVCANPEAMYVKADAYNLPDIRIISYDDYLRNSSNLDGKLYYLDDIDEFLESIGCAPAGFGGNV